MLMAGGGLDVVAGSIVFLAMMMDDTLDQQRGLESADLLSPGVAAFAVAYSAALELRLSAPSATPRRG